MEAQMRRKRKLWEEQIKPRTRRDNPSQLSPKKLKSRKTKNRLSNKRLTQKLRKKKNENF